MKKNHHVQAKFCQSRPNYREARWERAVKVYTINQESKYLLIQGIPSVGITKELVELFAIYGEVEEYRILDQYPSEEFTDTYWIKFKKIQSARFAKKKLDLRSFYGGILHVSYAPEFEAINDTRQKLLERKRQIERKCKENFKHQDKDQKEERTEDTKQNFQYKQSSVSQNSGHSVASEINNQNFIENQSDSPYVQAPFQALPLPPVHLPFFCYPPPPPPPSDYPKIPTKHATLPCDLQTISRTDMERDLVTSKKETTNVEIKANESNHKDYKEAKQIPISNCEGTAIIKNISYENRKSSEKKIVWMKHPSATSPFENASTSVPGAWDPFVKQRKQSKSLTGNKNLDEVAQKIREKLNKVSKVEKSFLEKRKIPEAEISTTSELCNLNEKKKTRKRI